MKFTVVDCKERDDVAYFTLMIEGPEGSGIAFASDGWKYTAGKILAPAVKWKSNTYPTMVPSPAAAEAIGKALADAGFEDPEFDQYSWTSAKWGQNRLKQLCNNEEIALSYWKKYR